MNKRICLLLLSLHIALLGQAQSFKFQASVNVVQQSGFHRILLPPDVVGHLNTNLTDIRLYDNKQQETPYVLRRQQPGQTAIFADYEIVSNQSSPNVSTAVVIRNQTKSRINSLSVVVKNTNVGKKVRLRGSSDTQNWYAIDDNIRLGPTQNAATTTEIKQISFPLSDYNYYKLVINDSASTPLNILRVGYYQQLVSAGSYSTIPDVSFSQRDSSDKNTYIHLTRPSDARFDKLAISVNASGPFHRRVEVGQFRTRKLKRGRIDHWFKVLRTFDLNSADSNVVYLPGTIAKDLYVVIDNDDNQPLVVQDVRAYQLTTYLLSNLTAGQSYQLQFSADNISAPMYDLTPFKTATAANQPVIGVGDFRPTDSNGDQAASFFTDSRLIWPALGIVLVALGLLSYRMLREMGTHQSNL